MFQNLNVCILFVIFLTKNMFNKIKVKNPLIQKGMERLKSIEAYHDILVGLVYWKHKKIIKFIKLILMKLIHDKYILLLTFNSVVSLSSFGQDNSRKKCTNLLNSGFVSDGQEYLTKLDENNIAKFFTTFYGGSQYRVIACTDIEDIPLLLTVYDTEKNLLFCNKDHNYINYWNFTFTSSIDCIIEIEFDVENQLKDEVMLLIGFKEK